MRRCDGTGIRSRLKICRSQGLVGSNPTTGTIKDKAPFNFDLKNLAYIIGVALGDGNLSNPNGRAVRLRVTCDLKYPFLISKIQTALKIAFPNNKVSLVKRSDHCVDISCFSNKLESLLGWKADLGSKFVQQAGIPKWIFSNAKYIIPCLRGLLETDGSIYLDRGYKAVFFTTVIPGLSEDFYEMVSILGFNFKRYTIEPKTNYNSKTRYNLRLTRNVQEFLNLIQPEKI